MKFIIAAVVLLAVAMGVQSSLVAGVPGIGLGIGGWGLGASGIGHGLSGYSGLGVHGLGHGLGLGLAAAVPAVGIVAPAHLPAAVNLHSSPLAYSSYASYSAPIGIHAPIAVHAPVAVPAIAGSVAHQAAVASPHVPHGATYVAKNRGAIHTAPLDGHVHSAASINLAPAPGTW